MNPKSLTVGVVGATGAVGRELFEILLGRKFPVGQLVAFASDRSKGKELKFGAKSVKCQVLQKDCFKGIDVAFFDASDEVSKEWVPEAAAAGTWVVDNSGAFRMDAEVPLVVPEVNTAALQKHVQSSTGSFKKKVIAGPNCTTVQLVVVLKALHEKFGLKRVVVSTYQSVSGAGTLAIDELKNQTQDILNGKDARPEIFPHRIAFNCIPHIGGFKDDGYTSEEQKVALESRKILGLPNLKIVCTAVRVPAISTHGESVNVELEKPFEMAQVFDALKLQEGIKLLDDPSQKIYPLGESHSGGSVEGASGRDAVYVGRVRRDPTLSNGLNLWIVSDNLRKGAALNAVQVGEKLLSLLQ